MKIMRAAVDKELIYDWKDYFRSHLNRISGFVRTPTQKEYARAIRLQRGKTGLVELTKVPQSNLRGEEQKVQLNHMVVMDL